MSIFDEAAGSGEVQDLTQDAEKAADQETGGTFDSEMADAGSELDHEAEQH